jgi:serine-type D-Ala-D-Ala carboxypeptidase
MKTSSELSRCSGIDTALKEIFEEALSRGCFSGAAAGFDITNDDKKDRCIWAFGKTALNSDTCITFSTFFDLASLTKPLVTALSFLAIMEEGGFDLHSKLGRVLLRKVPEQMGGVEIGQLLAHCSGLAAYRPYFKELINIEEVPERRESLFENILAEKFEYPPGSKHVYSDLGYIILGMAIEELSGLPLDVYWSEKILKPIGLQDKLLFNPIRNTSSTALFAATEKCPWSGDMLSGVVHDENCRAVGGVAGHAGLFGTVDGVLELCNHLVRQFRGEETHPAYSNEKLRQLLTRHGDSSWMYGFDTPSKIGSSSGMYFSDQSAGHLGFTGTSFWIDLARGISVVLLTNRVHPTRENDDIRRLRPLFHDTVMKALLKKEEDI